MDAVEADDGWFSLVQAAYDIVRKQVNEKDELRHFLGMFLEKKRPKKLPQHPLNHTY